MKKLLKDLQNKVWNLGESFMKKLIAILFAFYILTLPQISFGQSNLTQPITIAVVKSVEDGFTFTANQFAHNDQTKESQLTGNVDFQSKKFEFSGADRVIYNETNKKMTVYGCRDFTIDGKVVLKNSEKLTNILEYTIGDDKVYLF